MYICLIKHHMQRTHNMRKTSWIKRNWVRESPDGYVNVEIRKLAKLMGFVELRPSSLCSVRLESNASGL